MTEKTPVTRPKNETAARAMQILSLYHDHAELGLREMARLLGLSTSVTYRLANTLCHYRFLQQIPSSKSYILGSACLELAQRFREDDKFVSTCIAHMDALRDRTQETVALHVFRDGLRINVLESQSSQSIRHVMRPGERYPITYGASDIVIRATASPAQMERIREELERSGETGRAPTHEELEHFHLQGWAMSDGARVPGVSGVATPVYHPEALYVLSVLGPRERVLATGHEALAVHLLQAAKDLGYALSPLHASL